MNCVKCGREITEERVFCDECLRGMEDYPVKPGTAVHIPKRDPAEELKKPQPRRRPVRTLSEQVLRLKKKVLRLRILAVVLLLICGALCFAIGKITGRVNIQPLLGQNYHTAETAGQGNSGTP